MRFYSYLPSNVSPRYVVILCSIFFLNFPNPFNNINNLLVGLTTKFPLDLEQGETLP